MAVSGAANRKTPESLAGAVFNGISFSAKPGRKTPLTTGMTTDRKTKNSISGYSGVGTAPHLGCGDRAFESHYSDQKATEI